MYGDESDLLVPVNTHYPSSSSNSNGKYQPHLQLLAHLAAAAATTSTPAAAAAAAPIPAVLSLNATPAAAVIDTQSEAGLSPSGVIQLLAFCVFEVLIGMFWPSMMTLRARYVPEEQRSTIINIFRIPLNLFVCMILWKVSDQSLGVSRGAGE